MSSIDNLRADIQALLNETQKQIQDAVAKAQAASNDPAIDQLDTEVKAALAAMQQKAADVTQQAPASDPAPATSAS